MTYLDRFIGRMTAQRACLRWAVDAVADLPGLVLEFGLGSGRSYDFLRRHAPARDLYVFDRAVEAHPECVPPAERMVIGDFLATAPPLLQDWAEQAALIHADVGSSDRAASRSLAAALVPFWTLALRGNGLLVSDQPVETEYLREVDVPGNDPDHYHVYRRRAGSGPLFLSLEREPGADSGP